MFLVFCNFLFAFSEISIVNIINYQLKSIENFTLVEFFADN